MNTKLFTAAVFALGIVAGSAGLSLLSPATAQDSGQMDHSKMGHDMMMMGEPKGDQGESSKAFAKANMVMHGGMDIEFTGNADVDFAKGMIPHHQGAIDMAKIVLQYGQGSGNPQTGGRHHWRARGRDQAHDRMAGQERPIT